MMMLIACISSCAGGTCAATDLEPGIDYHDPALGNATGKDAGDCCKQCAISQFKPWQGCMFFTFDGNNTCFFAKDKQSRRERTGVVSGAVFSTLSCTSGKPCVIDGSNPSLAFDGHGGLSAGATSRLLIDYPEKQRGEILDYLFLPNFGASLGVLKIEIGGDTQSTDGTEASHMHSRDDLSCTRGYEGWLAKEARARNPAVKIWSLSWGVPGWIGNISGQAASYFSDDNIHYQVEWVKCLRDQWGVVSDYIGLWNERYS